jgi:uncharacterized membrane protein YbaN (DUF454 family)
MDMKKIALISLGLLSLLLGLVFIVVPGPSLIFLLPGFFVYHFITLKRVLSFEETKMPANCWHFLY